MRKVTKLFTTKSDSINEEEKTVVFRISDGTPDRHGEIVDQKSWDFSEYMDNPVLIANHDAGDIRNALGSAVELWYEAAEDATYGRYKFAVEANPLAMLAWQLVKAGVLRTVSVGFISEKTEYRDGIPVLMNNKLLETSCVLVPANPRAIALSFKDGSLTRKDALYLQDSMKKELAFIEEQLKEEELDDMTTKDATELNSKLDQVLELVGKIGGEVADLKAEVDTLSQARQDEEVADTTDDAEKTDDEAQNGSDEATGDKDEQDDSAKDGDNDQSGAEDIEIDLDAELTPELEAQLEAELAEAA